MTQLMHVKTRRLYEGYELNIHADVPLGQGIIGVFGHTGAGKSSWLKSMAGLENKAQTQVMIDGKIIELEPEQNPFVYQSQHPSLLPNVTIEKNLALIHKHSKWTGQNGLNYHAVIQLCGIESLLHKYAGELSGGQQQMVSFARTLLSGKSIILLDEPFSAMDWQVRRRKLQLIKQLNSEFGLVFILVSHQLDELALIAQHLIAIEAGEIALNGDTEEIIGALQSIEGEFKFSRLKLWFDAELPEHDLIRWRLGDAIDAPAVLSHTLESAQQQVALVEANKVVIMMANASDNISSAVNQVPAQITKIDARAGRVLLTLQVEEQTLLAEISGYSKDKMQLACGQQVIAQFKSI